MSAAKGRARGPSFDGMLVINKPSGMVSKDVSRWLEKRLGKMRLGHVGTLDPLAEGVLPLLLGNATRLQDHLLTLEKGYEFDVTFGKETETLDTEGRLVREEDCAHVTAVDLEAAAAELVGDFEQVPPIYSAIKYKGKPLYEYARTGEADQVPLEEMKKTVHIQSLDLVKFSDGVGTFRVVCSKGTYVRSLAAKLGEKVKSCGIVSRLVRTHASGVTLSHAHSLDELEQRLDQLDQLLVRTEDIDISLPRWKAWLPEMSQRLKLGQKLSLDMRNYELGLVAKNGRRPRIESVDTLMILSDGGQAMGLGSASIDPSGRIIVSMRRGLS